MLGEVFPGFVWETVISRGRPNLTFSSAVAIGVETVLFVGLAVDVLVE